MKSIDFDFSVVPFWSRLQTAWLILTGKPVVFYYVSSKGADA